MTTSLDSRMEEAMAAAACTEGCLYDVEMRFLFAAAARPTAQGEVLEIGSYKGKSTILLAKGSLQAGQGKIAACDPFSQPSPTDPEPGDDTYECFVRALEEAGVLSNVQVYRELSTQLARRWNRPIRLLWIDGDHRYEATRTDLEGFLPYLTPGAIVALHDVNSPFEGPIRCFIEDVVLSEGFGMCGMCKSIGWAQFVGQGCRSRYKKLKAKAYRLLTARRLKVTLGIRPNWRARHGYRRFREGWEWSKWVASVKDSV